MTDTRAHLQRPGRHPPTGFVCKRRLHVASALNLSESPARAGLAPPVCGLQHAYARVSARWLLASG
jgi:hypothetical protein